MFKTVTTIIVTAFGVLFAMQNFDHVPVYLFWGKALQIRLIFVIAIAGTGGYLIRHFIGMAREDRLKRKIQAARMHSANQSKRAAIQPKRKKTKVSPIDDSL